MVPLISILLSCRPQVKGSGEGSSGGTTTGKDYSGCPLDGKCCLPISRVKDQTPPESSRPGVSIHNSAKRVCRGAAPGTTSEFPFTVHKRNYTSWGMVERAEQASLTSNILLFLKQFQQCVFRRSKFKREIENLTYLCTLWQIHIL